MKLAQLRCINKRQFHNKAECAASIARGPKDVPLFAYHCPECGYWHKTKHDPRQYPSRDRREARGQ